MRKSDWEAVFYSVLKGQLNPLIIILSVKAYSQMCVLDKTDPWSYIALRSTFIFDAFGNSDLTGSEKSCGTQRSVEVSERLVDE